jgi:predicted MFS family arabinose efflux permease
MNVTSSCQAPMTIEATEDVPPAHGSRFSLRAVIMLLAASCGLTVANIYYSQPLLALIAKTFHTSQGSAAVVVTATQLGYAVGLLLLLPLGDLFENRTLTSRVLIGAAVALFAAAWSPNLVVFLVLSALIGLTSVVAQILIPLAAHLSPADRRGQYVGTVMSGLLLGILLARTVSSLVAAAFGWRTVYLASAVAMLLLSALLVVMLPTRRPDHTDSYPRLMASLGELVRSEPALRRRALCQALMFGSFSAFWTSVTFELISRHHLSQTGIAVFALVGAGGALAAPIAGRLGDRGHGAPASAAAFVLASVAMLAAILGAASLVLMAIAGVALDLAVQGHQVLSQREIYALRPDARARINTVFMGTVFLGGSIASAASGVLYQRFGWTGAALLSAILPVVGFAVWAVSTAFERTAGVSAPA